MNLFNSRYLSLDLDPGNYCLGFRRMLGVWFVYLGPVIMRLGRDTLAEAMNEITVDTGLVKLTLTPEGKWDIHESERHYD
jgi:hypothetical protein